MHGSLDASRAIRFLLFSFFLLYFYSLIGSEGEVPTRCYKSKFEFRSKLGCSFCYFFLIPHSFPHLRFSPLPNFSLGPEGRFAATPLTKENYFYHLQILIFSKTIWRTGVRRPRGKELDNWIYNLPPVSVSDYLRSSSAFCRFLLMYSFSLLTEGRRKDVERRTGVRDLERSLMTLNVLDFH